MTIEEVKLQFSGYIAAKKLVLELAAEKLRLRADMDALNQKLVTARVECLEQLRRLEAAAGACGEAFVDDDD